MMAKNCGKKFDFFLKLVHSRNHADCYMSADEAKKLGICTDIGIPRMSIDISVSYNLELKNQ
jgi:ATP-dependent protease ClpP protease subunit